ncbi:hypothetical protein TB2_043473 [Malus domestica]
MGCNGCRVLRKGCSDTCILRSCLYWIDSTEAQGNTTLFLTNILAACFFSVGLSLRWRISMSTRLSDINPKVRPDC